LTEKQISNGNILTIWHTQLMLLLQQSNLKTIWYSSSNYHVVTVNRKFCGGADLSYVGLVEVNS